MCCRCLNQVTEYTKEFTLVIKKHIENTHQTTSNIEKIINLEFVIKTLNLYKEKYASKGINKLDGDIEEMISYIKKNISDLENFKSTVFYSSVEKQLKTDKGNRIDYIPNEYIVIDVETTGLNPKCDNIIEIAAIYIQNDIVIDTFSSLIKISDEIPPRIQQITGITNKMLSCSPNLRQVLSDFQKFVGTHIVIGHNVNFDIGFISNAFENCLETAFTNDFVDTLRLSKIVFPTLSSYKLSSLKTEFNLTGENSHRALSDCFLTVELCKYIDKNMKTRDNDTSHKNINCNNTKEERIIPYLREEPDISHPLFGKTCVFTGTFEGLSRDDLIKLIESIGGINANNVTKKTDYLIIGQTDYRVVSADGKSNKIKKAEEYILKGINLQIISEEIFSEMICIGVAND